MEESQPGMEQFWREALDVQERVYRTQGGAIRKAAHLCAGCIERDGVIHTFGSGHSRSFAMELVHRAGGMAPFNRIDLDDLALYAGWPLERVRSLEFERDQEAGRVLLNYHRIEPQDIFLVASQSGVNKGVVECALQIRDRGHTLIAITSLEHSQQTTTRHPSGKKLYELADLVIDNCGSYGDTLLDLPSGGKICSTSSLAGVLIAQLLNAEIASELLRRGIEPPAFLSDNISGGIERNEKLQQRYSGRVRWLG